MKTVDYDQLVMTLAFVFLALAGLLAVVGIFLAPFVIIVALLFAAVAYFMWYQASGRLGHRLYQRVEEGARVNNGQRQRQRQKARRKQRARQRANARQQQGQEQKRNKRDGFGAAREWDPREEWTRGNGFDTDPRRGRGKRQRRQGSGRTSSNGDRMSPSTAEAYDTLGLDPDADEATIKSAYREKVKNVHPDTETGSKEAFKRVNAAYEQLIDD